MRSTQTSKLNRWMSLSRKKRVGSFAVGAMGLLVAFFFVPSSPGMMLRANFIHGMGCVKSAVAVYDTVAEKGLTVSQRSTALKRSAVLYDVALNKDEESLIRWKRYAQTNTDVEAQAYAWSQVAELYANMEDASVASAKAFEKAAERTQQDEDAVRHWMAASEQWLLASNSREATLIWTKIADNYSAHRSQAYVALGQWHLGVGRSEQALTWFERSVETALTEDQRGLAKIGVAICLERLGNLDEAIAELDEADFPEDVRHVRRRKMLERSDQLQPE